MANDIVHPASAPGEDFGTRFGNVLRTAEELDSPKVQMVVEEVPTGGTTSQVDLNATNAAIVSYKNECRRALLLTNLGATDVWYGFGPNVSKINGALLVGTKGFTITLPTQLSVYAIADTGTARVSVTELTQ